MEDEHNTSSESLNTGQDDRRTGKDPISTNTDDQQKRVIENDNEKEMIEWVDDESEEEEARVALGLVGKIWTNRHINQNAFMATMKNIRQPKMDVDIRNIGKNLYVFQFHHWRDKQKVIDGQPWHFDKHLILMADVKGNSKPSDIQLFEFPI